MARFYTTKGKTCVMDSFGKEMIIGAFEKHGLVYHVIIAKDSFDDPENLIGSGKFKGIFLHPLRKNICVFYIHMDEDGRWIPDKKKSIDPWIADCVGEIIENNLV